jgi:hypothetical protein
VFSAGHFVTRPFVFRDIVGSSFIFTSFSVLILLSANFFLFNDRPSAWNGVISVSLFTIIKIVAFRERFARCESHCYVQKSPVFKAPLPERSVKALLAARVLRPHQLRAVASGCSWNPSTPFGKGIPTPCGEVRDFARTHFARAVTGTLTATG